VLIIGSEALPFAKTGGLADVLGALPPALARLGWDATLALPKYRGTTAGPLVERFGVACGGYRRDVGFHEVPLVDGARALLIDCPELYDRQGLGRSGLGGRRDRRWRRHDRRRDGLGDRWPQG
jgi:starch synthase